MIGQDDAGWLGIFGEWKNYDRVKGDLGQEEGLQKGHGSVLGGWVEYKGQRMQKKERGAAFEDETKRKLKKPFGKAAPQKTCKIQSMEGTYPWRKTTAGGQGSCGEKHSRER